MPATPVSSAHQPTHSLIQSFIYLFIHSFMHPLSPPLLHSFKPSLNYAFAHLHSFIHLLAHSFSVGSQILCLLRASAPLGGQVCSEQQELLHAWPLSLSAWGCLKRGGSPQWVPLESEEMSLLPRHQSSINNGAACSQWQALWKPQSRERWGECVRKELAGCPRGRLCQCSILPERVLGATLTALSPSYLSQP